MRIYEAAQLSELTKPQPKSSLSMTKVEISAQVDTKNTRMLASKNFILVRVALNKLASPIKAAADKSTEIVADLNVNKIGRTSHGFYPKVIVVSGQNQFQNAHAERRITAHVWLGELAAQALDIKADHLMSSEELRTKLQGQLDVREGMSPSVPGTYIQDVYPFENYFIYHKETKQFRQSFEIDGRTNILLTGTPTEVVTQYVPTTRMEAAMGLVSIKACAGKKGCSCGCSHKKEDVKAADQEACAMKGGKKVTYAQANSSYMTACKKGYKPSMKAVSPPGWSGVTRKMKEHKEIDNPFALAWWMDEQGYEPHVPEEK